MQKKATETEKLLYIQYNKTLTSTINRYCMHHWEILGVPALMLSDYYLTIKGNLYATKQYKLHFITETYELNPVFRKDVDNFKWFNPRHLAGTVLVTLLLWLASSLEDEDFYRGVLGYSFTIFGLINGRHIGNIVLFRYLIKHPELVEGKIHLSHLFVLKTSQLYLLSIALPVLLLLLMQPSALLIGAFLGCIVIFITHYIWISKYKYKLRHPEEVSTGQKEEPATFE